MLDDPPTGKIPFFELLGNGRRILYQRDMVGAATAALGRIQSWWLPRYQGFFTGNWPAELSVHGTVFGDEKYGPRIEQEEKKPSDLGSHLGTLSSDAPPT